MSIRRIGSVTEDVKRHEVDTTNVHGIADTSLVVTTTGTQTLTNKSLTSPTITGTPTAPTAAADTNTTQVATTAFMVGQAGSASPAMNGTAAVGTSLRYARQDHVHPSDTTKANLASPTFTGTPAAPTAAADTNTTQLATTAYVVGQAGSATPLVDGTAAVGTSLRYARQDHVHGTDTTRAALASPTFTGTPAAPTAAADTSTTQIATTAFVLGQASSTNPVMDGTAAVGTSTRFARADHVHPTDTSRAASTHTHTSTGITAVDINSQSASYTLVAADASKLVLMASASAQTVTIPTNASVAFATGTKIDIVQTGAGACDIVGASGVTLNSEGSKKKINAQYQAVSIIKTGTDEWLLIGALKT